jgi:DNA-directed RNA polymerase specialized sigma24 family protein
VVCPSLMLSIISGVIAKHCRPEFKDDAVGLASVRVYSALDTGFTPDNPQGWIATMTHRAIADLSRKQWTLVDDADLFNLVDHRHLQESDVVDYYEYLSDSPQIREILDLKHQGYSNREVANKLGLSRSEVDRTLIKLRDRVDADVFTIR